MLVISMSTIESLSAEFKDYELGGCPASFMVQ